jgi:hypothetical protein
MASAVDQTIGIDLTAAVTALVGGSPAILTVPSRDPNTDASALPSGPFAPLRHRTLELGLRGFVEDQTGFRLGYIEQLYTFGDRGRHATSPTSAPHVMSIGYLALTRNDADESEDAPWSWQSWYQFFPWEDWRAGVRRCWTRSFCRRCTLGCARRAAMNRRVDPQPRAARGAGLWRCAG